MSAPRSWAFNGRRYWAIQVDGGEVVASTVDAYTPHFPPLGASFEVYRTKRGIPQFLGYAQGATRERLYTCFCHAFASY